MKCVKPASGTRAALREQASRTAEPAVSTSTPELALQATTSPRKFRDKPITPRDGHSASATNVALRQHDITIEEAIPFDSKARASGDDFGLDMQRRRNPNHSPHNLRGQHSPTGTRPKVIQQENPTKCGHSSTTKKHTAHLLQDAEPGIVRQIREIHNDIRTSSRVIKESRSKLLEIKKKEYKGETDLKDLSDRHDLLLHEMERFDRLTRILQKLVYTEVRSHRKAHEHKSPPKSNYLSSPGVYDPAMYIDLKMPYDSPAAQTPFSPLAGELTRSQSEIDLTRRLSESYDMQEKLVADNADLEVKRYMLYKELMTKDQNLETCRGQIMRLQAELKLMSKENLLLHERLSKNNPEGDATPINDLVKPEGYNDNQEDSKLKSTEQQRANLAEPDDSTKHLEEQVSGLEEVIQEVRLEMDQIKKAAEARSAAGPGPGACRGGAMGPNTCHQPTGGPPPPAMYKACGVCPPCPAPCNPSAAPTPAEKEVARLTIQLRQTEENFKTKVTECALLRADFMKKKEELEKERCMHRELQNKMRELEMKYEGLRTHTNMMLGTKEQAFENEINVRALKQCYREAREEIDELRLLMKEQNEQLQDYRVKYMQAQQLVEEQKRQIDLMDMDNTRISEQINLEIQKVKLKFQEKLNELAPIPDLLAATQARLKDAQQSQAIAEHNAEQLARELNVARERVHVLLHNAVKPPEKTIDRTIDEKQMTMLQQRISQLTDANIALKNEIERLKHNVIRMEEAMLTTEKRLQEKLNECVQLGGELDRTRDEAARMLQRANERMDTVKKCMQTTISELERQLAAAKGQLRAAEKEREEIQCRMSCQIERLKENFEQAQMRILGLTTQVATLRHSASSTGEVDAEGDGECVCKTLFENP